MKSISAKPFAFPFALNRIGLVVIDMQPIVPTIARLLQGFRDAGLPVIHTRECHKPDLSDLPDAKRDRGNPSLRIGDPGPMGRILVDGEQGAEIIPELAPMPGEIVLNKPGKGAFFGDMIAFWPLMPLKAISPPTKQPPLR